MVGSQHVDGDQQHIRPSVFALAGTHASDTAKNHNLGQGQELHARGSVARWIVRAAQPRLEGVQAVGQKRASGGIGWWLVLAGAWLAWRAWNQWSDNPLIRAPHNDAEVYWDWAGRIAAGEWIGSEPFFSAPLYPYFLGILRSLGAGIPLVIAVQIVLLLLAAWRLHKIALQQMQPRIAWLAPLLFLLWSDTSTSSLRLLNNTLVALLVILLWERWLALRQRIHPTGVIICSLCLGLNLLANPVMLLVVPAYGWWLWKHSERRWSAPLVGMSLSLLCVLPATLHNRIACGEWILISAQAGVTFVHGNAPGAQGVYQAIPGVSIDRARQNQEARARVRSHTDGSWRATDAAYFREGWDYLRAQPSEALRLFAQKLRWFCFGDEYGDIYIPQLEAEAGLDPWRWPAVLPVALFLPAALLAAAWATRERRAARWEWLFLLIPLLTVLLFFYSPRYRFPALPWMAIYSAQALAILWQTRARDLRGASVALALCVAALHQTLSLGTSFRSLEPYRAAHERSLAAAWQRLEQWEPAYLAFQRAAALGDPIAPVAAADTLRRMGKRAMARVELEDWLMEHPADAFAHKTYGIVLAESGEFSAAQAALQRALELAPTDAETQAALERVQRELESKR